MSASSSSVIPQGAASPQMYLASQSPRRCELLRQLNYRFEQLSAHIDETPGVDEPAEDYVIRMALEKAQAGWRHAQRTCEIPLLASDTCVVLNGQILGKPVDAAHAQVMLQSLSGQTHQVMTSVAVWLGANYETELSITDVTFARLSPAEIDWYCSSSEPFDKAGAYGIQGLAARFVRHISGSYSGVVGLPLYETARLLQRFGVEPGSFDQRTG